MNEAEKTICREVGMRIRECRKKQKLTQVELAKKMGISRSKIVQNELGMTNMPQSTLYQYAKHLDVTVDYLLGTETNHNVFNEFLGYNFTKEEQSEIRSYLYYLLSKRGAYHG